MLRLLSELIFVVMVSATPAPANPFEGTDTTVEEETTLSITYSGPDTSITITDRGDGEWQVEIVSGGASWEVPAEADTFLILKDTHGDSWAAFISEN